MSAKILNFGEKESSEWNDDLRCNIFRITIMEKGTVCIDVQDNDSSDLTGAFVLCEKIIKHPKRIIVRNMVGIQSVYLKLEDGSMRVFYDSDNVTKSNGEPLSASIYKDVEKDFDIVSIIRESIDLSKHGSSYVGKCPFHGSRTPNLYVTPSMNNWYCFSCKKGGGITEWIEERYGLDSIEALSHLAGRKMKALSTNGETNEPRQA